MTFPEFFEFVDDLITSKVEVVNLLHGTSFKIIYDPNMTWVNTGSVLMVVELPYVRLQV